MADCIKIIDIKPPPVFPALIFLIKEVTSAVGSESPIDDTFFTWRRPAIRSDISGGIDYTIHRIRFTPDSGNVTISGNIQQSTTTATINIGTDPVVATFGPIAAVSGVETILTFTPFIADSTDLGGGQSNIYYLTITSDGPFTIPYDAITGTPDGDFFGSTRGIGGMTYNTTDYNMAYDYTI